MHHAALFADLAANPAAARYLQAGLDGLSMGALFALVALGYTMVYGIVELINFAHGDLFMLGTFFGLTVLTGLGLTASGTTLDTGSVVLGVAAMLVTVPLFCAGLNWGVDRVIYKPLRTAPKLAPLVSAIGVSFVFMNLGQFWNAVVPDRKFLPAEDVSAVVAEDDGTFTVVRADGKRNRYAHARESAGGWVVSESVPSASDRSFPALLPDRNLIDGSGLRFTFKDALVVGVTVPIMVALTLFVKFTPLGKAMRATAQNPVAAQLMGINSDRVIGATFLLGGGLGGVGSVVYALSVGTIGFQVGFTNGLYAFTAAVLGGIGNIPGAVLGGLLIGLTRSLGSATIGERWTSALVFVILIVILVFRPTGLLGSRTREKV